MTNKETATMLKSIRGLFSVSYSPESIVALSKAIELIEQMPDEHGDLIDRDELKENSVMTMRLTTMRGSILMQRRSLSRAKTGCAYPITYVRPKDCPIKDELVLCGECYYKDEKRIMDEDALWCRRHHMYVSADWFCADGDRK